ncbi:MAG: hypothetical protein WBE40_02535 [Thermoplasmata archaeon]
MDRRVDGTAARVFLPKSACGRYQSPWNVIRSHECWDAAPIDF